MFQIVAFVTFVGALWVQLVCADVSQGKVYLQITILFLIKQNFYRNLEN